MSDAATKILILGGGFGGLYTAIELEKQLARNPNVEITLVNRENFFSFTPMLHGGRWRPAGQHCNDVS